MLEAIGFKICLYPNKYQEELLYKFCNHCRGLYNLLLQESKDFYKECNKIVTLKYLYDYTKMIREQEEYRWIKELPASCSYQVVKDLIDAYRRVFNSGFGFPKFKSKRRSKLSFYQRSDTIRFYGNRVSITGIGRIKCQQGNYPEYGYCNPRVTYDGKHWYLSLSIMGNFSGSIDKEVTEGIGIDLGIHNLLTISNGTTVPNPNKILPELKRLDKKLKRLQQEYSRKLEKNKLPTGKIVHTKNSEKLLRKINLVKRRINNIKLNFYHHVTIGLVRTKPEFIAMETLSIKDMKEEANNVSKYLQQIALYEVTRQLEYKSKAFNIPFVKIDRYYPSTKKCSKCGNIQDISLSERQYNCNNCGNNMDRDLNAAINIREEGKRLLAV